MEFYSPIVNLYNYTTYRDLYQPKTTFFLQNYLKNDNNFS